MAAQTARWVITFSLCSSVKPCPAQHHQGYLVGTTTLLPRNHSSNCRPAGRPAKSDNEHRKNFSAGNARWLCSVAPSPAAGVGTSCTRAPWLQEAGSWSGREQSGGAAEQVGRREQQLAAHWGPGSPARCFPTLSLLNCLSRRASCLNGMILIKILLQGELS